MLINIIFKLPSNINEINFNTVVTLAFASLFRDGELIYKASIPTNNSL